MQFSLISIWNRHLVGLPQSVYPSWQDVLTYRIASPQYSRWENTFFWQLNSGAPIQTGISGSADVWWWVRRRKVYATCQSQIAVSPYLLPLFVGYLSPHPWGLLKYKNQEMNFIMLELLLTNSWWKQNHTFVIKAHQPTDPRVFLSCI